MEGLSRALKRRGPLPLRLDTMFFNPYRRNTMHPEIHSILMANAEHLLHGLNQNEDGLNWSLISQTELELAAFGADYGIKEENHPDLLLIRNIWPNDDGGPVWALYKPEDAIIIAKGDDLSELWLRPSFRTALGLPAARDRDSWRRPRDRRVFNLFGFEFSIPGF